MKKIIIALVLCMLSLMAIAEEYPLECDGCGKSLYEEESKTNWIGYRFSFDISEDRMPFFQKQMGVYEIREYNVCWECYLRNLGVKP